MRVHGKSGAVYLSAEAGAAAVKVAHVYQWSAEIKSPNQNTTKYADPQTSYTRENIVDRAGRIAAYWSASERMLWQVAIKHEPVTLALYPVDGEPAWWIGTVILSVTLALTTTGAVVLNAEWVPARTPPRVSAKLAGRTSIHVSIAPLALTIPQPLAATSGIAIGVGEATLAAHPLFANTGITVSSTEPDLRPTAALAASTTFLVSTVANFTRGAATLSAASGFFVFTSAPLTVYASSTVAARPAPPTPAFDSSPNTASPSYTSGFYKVAVAYMYADGANQYFSSLSAPSGTWVMSGTNKFHVYNLTPGPSFVISRFLYYAFGGSGGAGPYTFTGGANLETVANNTSTETHANVANIAGLPPDTPYGYFTGNTYVYVDNCERFRTSGSASVAGQTISWTGKTASSGVGALTGVTGITANIPVGSTITML